MNVFPVISIQNSVGLFGGTPRLLKEVVPNKSTQKHVKVIRILTALKKSQSGILYMNTPASAPP